MPSTQKSVAAEQLSNSARDGRCFITQPPAAQVMVEGQFGTHGSLPLPDAQIHVSATQWGIPEPDHHSPWLYRFDWTDESVTFQNYGLVAQVPYGVRPGVRMLQPPGHSWGTSRCCDAEGRRPQRDRPRQAEEPPSTVTVAPITYEAAGDTR